MGYSGEFNRLSKVYYRPIEAAIRWSGLARRERQILGALKRKTIPEPDDFPHWPALRLNTERLYDAIVNAELRYGVDGVTVEDKCCAEHPNLTIRHVDLKAWMIRYYPEQRPDFLFSSVERSAHPTITINAVHVLLLERDTLKSQLEQRDREAHVLRRQYSALLKKRDVLIEPEASDGKLSPRSETTYLHTIGGLLSLLLGHAPSGQPYSSFKTQESIISAMIAHHGESMGIAERTLQAKFAAAKRKLSMD